MEDMKALVDRLNYLTKKYDEGHPEVSDKEWDELYFKLVQMEEDMGIHLDESPTQTIIYQVVNELRKVEHNHKMLSLDKTKEIEEVKKFLGKDNDYVAMCKMDGLTCSLRYIGGKLISAETRGNGVIGEDILHNALVIPSIPKTISYQDELIVDGEIICTYEDFKPFSDTYKNPRNFAAGSIRLLDSKECAKRNLTFVAWDVIKGFPNDNNVYSRLLLLTFNGFTIVPFEKGSVEHCIEWLTETAKCMSYPIDGIVFKFDEVDFGKQQGETAHHFKNAIAYKFYDDEYETTLQNIEYSMGRTGILTPVAVYEDIDIDGSVCNRASLHNLSIMTELLGDLPYKGEKIWIYKANMIIPQVSKAEKRNSSEDFHFDIPKICPVCGSRTAINESSQLYCTNPDCDGKLINKLDHFCGKKGLDIKGLSKATLEKLIDWGWVNNCVDLFSLQDHVKEWVVKPGFGAKSVEKILDSIEESKNCSTEAFIASLGIPLIGRTIAADLAKRFETYEALSKAIDEGYDFTKLPGFAWAKSQALTNFDYTEADKLYGILNVKPAPTVVEASEQPLKDMKFVITGSVKHFKNRTELQSSIEKCGGKVVSAISKNVDYLINNDAESTSAKNVAAKKLGIPILTEEEFLEKIS